jgi:hypothetical protein
MLHRPAAVRRWPHAPRARPCAQSPCARLELCICPCARLELCITSVDEQGSVCDICVGLGGMRAFWGLSRHVAAAVQLHTLGECAAVAYSSL